MQKNVVIYTRVSTKEQADSGFSLSFQKEALKRYCEARGLNIVAHFEEDFSAKDFDRPQWNKLFEFVLQKRKQIDTVLCLRWDRFSRNVQAALGMISKFKRLGIQIETAEQPIDLSVPENKLLLSFYLTMPEIENDKNSIRTTDGSRQARLEGCWTGTPPFGYKNHRNKDGKSTLIPSQDAPLVKEIFDHFSKGLYSADELRKKFREKGLKLCKMAFMNMLRNISYTGKVYVKEWGKNEAVVVEGLHEPLITEDVYDAVQEVLAGRKKKIKPLFLASVAELPLRGLIKCKVCGGSLTGSRSKGRSNSYYYYHCNKSGHERFRADFANNRFEKFLASFQFPDEIVNLYEAILKDSLLQGKSSEKQKLEGLEAQLKKIKLNIEKLEDLLLEDKITAEDYKSMKRRYSENENNLICQFTELKMAEKISSKQLQFGVSLVRNLKSFYESASVSSKRSIIGSIFPEKLEFIDGDYRTTRINEVLNLLLLINKELAKVPTKKASNLADLSSIAPPVGLEPTTL